MGALEGISARGISLEFIDTNRSLWSTFPWLRNGLDLETDMTDGSFFLDVVDIVTCIS